MRVAKIKNFGALQNVNNHNTRKVTTWINEDGEKVEMKHIDGNRKHLNKLRIGSLQPDRDIKDRLDSLGITKLRKNGVLALEYVLSASPEFFEGKGEENLEKFCEKAEEWLKEEFGAENVVNCHLHMDESTPHLHAICLPVVAFKSKAKKQRSNRKYADWKLNADNYTGGRARLSLAQDTYHSYVEELGLKRGNKKVRLEELDTYAEKASALAKEHRLMKESVTALEAEKTELNSQLTSIQQEYSEWDDDLMKLLKEHGQLLKRSQEYAKTMNSSIDEAKRETLDTEESIAKVKRLNEEALKARSLLKEKNREIEEFNKNLQEKVRKKNNGIGF